MSDRWKARDLLGTTIMLMLRVVVVSLPVIAGCVGNIQRSARVPHPGVPLSAGQPLDTPAELSAGLSNVTDVIKPAVGDASQAVEVPATEMRDELRFRLSDRWKLALIYEQGFAATSRQPDATQAPIGPGDVRGYGVSAGYAFETSTPGLSIGTTLEVMGWSVPYVEYETCTNCVETYTIIAHGRANPMTLGLGIAPSYRSGRVTYFGGVFARNHPTTERKEYNTDITFSDNGDVQDGPFNILLDAGVELEVMGWSVPYVEYKTCTNCMETYTIIAHGRANPMTLGLGIAPSYRSGRVTYFGGVFARNHPTTERKEYNTDITFDDNGDVQDGPFNVLLDAGIELELERWLSAVVVVHQDVVANPVRYGPGFGLALTARLGQ